MKNPGTASALPLRLRVFAGPNGSGKSTVIRAIKERKENNKLLDLGVYVNADDIAFALREATFQPLRLMRKVELLLLLLQRSEHTTHENE